MTEGYVDAGKLEVQVVADLKGFAADLRTKLTAATKNIEATVGVKVDTKTLKAQLRAAAKEATGVNATIGVKISTTGLQAQLNAAARGGKFTLPVRLNVSTTGVQAQLNRAARGGAFTVKVNADVDTAALQRRLKNTVLPGGGGAPGGPGGGPADPADPKATLTLAQAQERLTQAMRGAERAALNAETAKRRMMQAERDGGKESAKFRRAQLDAADAQDKRTAAIAKAKSALEDWSAVRRPVTTVQVQVDRLKALAQLNELSRDREVTLDVNVDKDKAAAKASSAMSAVTKGLNSVMSGIGALGMPMVFSGLAVSAIGAVGALGALSAAIAPVVSNLLLLPAAAGAGAVAIGTLVVGFHGLGEAFKALSSKDLTKWRAALEKLTPAAKDVALAMYQIQPVLTSTRKAVQETLLTGIGGDIRTFASTYLGPNGPIGAALSGSAKSWNKSFRSVFDYLSSKTTVPVVASGLRQAVAAGDELAKTLRPLTNIFVQLFAAGMPYVVRMSRGIADMVTKLSDFVQFSRQSGGMTAFFERGFDVAKQLGRILRDLAIGLYSFFSAGQTAGEGMLDSIEKAVAKFREFTASAEGQQKFRAFFEDSRRVMAGLAAVIGYISAKILGLISLFHKLPPTAQAVIGPLLVLAGGAAMLLGKLGPLIGVLARFGPMLAAIGGGGAATTIAAIAAPIALIAGAFLYAYTQVSAFRSLVHDTFATLGAVVSSAWTIVQPVFTMMGAIFRDTIKPAIDDAIRIMSEKLRPVLKTISDTYAKYVQPALEGIAKHLKDAEPEIRKFATYLGNVIRYLAGLTDTRLVQVAIDLLGKAFAGFGHNVGMVVDGFKLWIQLVESVPARLRKIADEIGKFYDDLPGPIKWAMDKAGADKYVKGAQDKLRQVAAAGDKMWAEPPKPRGAAVKPEAVVANVADRRAEYAEQLTQLDKYVKAVEAASGKTAALKMRLQLQDERGRIVTDATQLLANTVGVLAGADKKTAATFRAEIVTNLGSVTGEIAAVERMLKDPKLTTPEAIKLRADLTGLQQAKTQANVLLQIADRTIKLNVDKSQFEATIKTAEALLKNNPNLPAQVVTAIKANIDDAKAKLGVITADLKSPDLVNPKVIEVRGNVQDARNKVAALTAEMNDPKTPWNRKQEIKAELVGLDKSIDAGLGMLAALPAIVGKNGEAIGDSWGKALLETLPPAAKVAAIEAAIAAVEAFNQYALRHLFKTAGPLSPAEINRRRNQMISDKGLPGRAELNTALAAAKKEAAAAKKVKPAAGLRTGGPVAGKDGWKDTEADRKAKAAEATRKREEAAAKRAQAAKEKAEREAAKRAEAVRGAVQLIANKGFIAGLTGTLGQIKSTANQMVGFVKGALGKAALPITERIQADTARLTALGVQRDKIVKKLTTAQAQLKDLVEKAAQTRAQIADTIRGSFSLLDNAATDTAASMIDRLTKAVDAAKRFTASIQALRSRGLSADLLGQLAAGGPAAQGTADMLTQATGEELSKINQMYGDLKTQADTGGKVVADAMYGAGISAAQGLVNGLLTQKKAVEASMTTIAVALQNSLKLALKIKSPSQVMFALGGDTMAGFNEGLMGPTAGITKTLTTWASTTMNSVVGAFRTGVTGVAAAWGGIVEAAKAPVRVVIDVAINKGIIAAYNSVASQFGVKGATPFTIPKALQASAPIKRATGGPVYGAGTATSDSIPALLSNNEHVLAAKEVKGLGGHGAVEAIRAAARRGGTRFAEGGGLSGSGPATYPSMVAWLKKNFPQARAGTYQPSFGYHRSAPGGYAADIFAPGVGEGAAPAMAVFEGIRNTFKKHIQELIYTWAGHRQVWNGEDWTFTGGALQASHRTHIHWSMLADGFGAGISDVVNPAKAIIDKAIAGVKNNPNLTSPFGQVLAAGAAQLGKLVGPAADTKLTAGPETLVGDPKSMPLPKGTDLAGLPASVTRWAPTVLAVLRQLGQPESNLGAVLRRINLESTGNPNAINLYDSNARAGHPSQGLMQTIPTTFAAHVGPYKGRAITDPLANIYAGLHYAIGRYGSIAAIDPRVRPTGYDNGGWLKPNQLGVNTTGRPEAVFSHGEFDRLVAALESTANRPALVPGRGAGGLGMRPLASLTTPSQRAASAQIDTTAAAPVINVYPRATQSEAEIARGVSRELAWQGTPW